MRIEIGSNFWLSPEEVGESSAHFNPEVYGCEGTDFVWTSTGRSAISLILQSIEIEVPQRKRAILPVFTCHTVVDPFVRAGFEIFPYYIGSDLVVDEEYLQKLIKDVKPSVLLFHNYFGFETFRLSSTTWDYLNYFNTLVIEDCTQSLYSRFPKSRADFFVASIRKWSGVPDGGFAVRSKGYFNHRPIVYDKILEKAKVEASLLKYDYIVHQKGSKKAFMDAFSMAENRINQQKEIFSIAPVSSYVQRHLDVKDLCRRRVQNYTQLYDALYDKSDLNTVFSSLKHYDDVIPLYFPVYCDDRKRVQSILASHDIYAPILWPCPKEYAGIEDATIRYIYDHLLCIPIDQRYDCDDMNRIIEVLV